MMTTAIDHTLRNLTVRIKRYDPEGDADPRWQEFKISADPMDRVLDVLLTIKDSQDESLGLRRSCAHGVCGSDAMRINGVNALACKTLVRSLASDVMTIEPILGLPVIKDLIVNMKPFFDHYKSVMPYLVNDDPPPTTERLQSPEQRRGSTTRPSASSAPVARPLARRSGGTRSTSAPRRSSTPIVSYSTRAIRAPPNASRSSTTPKASGDAVPFSTVPPPVRVISRSQRPSRRSSTPCSPAASIPHKLPRLASRGD